MTIVTSVQFRLDQTVETRWSRNDSEHYYLLQFTHPSMIILYFYHKIISCQDLTQYRYKWSVCNEILSRFCKTIYIFPKIIVEINVNGCDCNTEMVILTMDMGHRFYILWLCVMQHWLSLVGCVHQSSSVILLCAPLSSVPCLVQFHSVIIEWISENSAGLFVWLIL